MLKLFILPAFLAGFGAVFIFSSAQRLWKASRDPKLGEAILWGTIGLLMGTAFIGIAARWFFGNVKYVGR